MTKQPLVVHCPAGSVEGTISADGQARFLGIPFATANRFEAPQPYPIWHDVRDATRYYSRSPQTDSMMEGFLGSSTIETSEDCLGLNIYTPSTAGDALKPVLFWIHGGAYTNGTGSSGWYDGTRLSSHGDVVVVTINYRLGIFGFLRDTNCGLLDQIRALNWVRENISAFGGDPQRVTIFGESAGGSSVVALMGSDQTAGLFHAAWAMSPSVGQLRSQLRASEVEKQILQAAGKNSVADLLALSADELTALQQSLGIDAKFANDGFAPTFGGAGLPLDAMQRMHDNPVPLVIGTTKDENRLWTALAPESASFTTDKLDERFVSQFKEIAPLARSTYERNRPGYSIVELAAALATDVQFRSHAWNIATKRSANNNSTWMYWFTYASTAFNGIFGSCHALDIPFAFDNLAQQAVDTLTGTADDRQDVASVYSAALLHLAHHHSADWDLYESNERWTLQIDTHSAVKSELDAELYALWNA